jgi:MFS family permease
MVDVKFFNELSALFEARERRAQENMSAEPVRRVGYVELVRRNANFRRVWLAQIVSEMGDWLNFVALLQLIKEYAPGAQSAGALIIMQLLPFFLLSPAAGVVADRFNRRHVMIAADLARCVVVLGFFLVDRPERIWLLYALAGLQFSITAFFEPARQALIPTLVKDEELVAANALTGVTWSLVFAVGGLLGGVIAGLFSGSAAFICDAGSFLVSAGFLLRFSSRVGAGRTERREASARDGGFFEAVRYLRDHPPALCVTLVKSGITTGAAAIELLSVIYGQQTFPLGKNGAVSVGILYGAHGLGAFLGAAISGRMFSLANAGAVIFWLFAARCAFFLLLGAAPNLPTAALASALIACCGSQLWVASTTTLQRLVPDDLRGRIFAIEFAMLTAVMAAFLWGLGYVIDRRGWAPSQAALAISGVTAVIAAAWLAVIMRFPVGEPSPGKRFFRNPT